MKILEYLVLIVVYKIQKTQNSVIIVERILHQFARNVEGQIHSILDFVVNVDFLYGNVNTSKHLPIPSIEPIYIIWLLK